MKNILSLHKNGLPPKAYICPDIFKNEMREVFHKNWVFIGFKSSLSKPNDFITASIGGVPVVVQNFDGYLKAFLNVCAHRRASLQITDCGNRKLICPYHGWTYDKYGRPVGIPDNQNSFRIQSDNESNKIGLKEYELEICGNFVFVCIEPSRETLREFLNVHWDVIEHISNLIKFPLKNRKIPWLANWKIGVESVLEIYHVAQVHPETFKKFTQSRWDFSAQGKHSTGHSDLSPEAIKWWGRVRRLIGLPKSELLSDYNHYFIYPNLAIAVTNGTLMSVQTYDPVDSGECFLNYRLFVGETVETSSISGVHEDSIFNSVTTFNEQVLNEDRLISEQCQLNMNFVDNPAIMGTCEDRIFDFHESLRSDVNYGVL